MAKGFLVFGFAISAVLLMGCGGSPNGPVPAPAGYISRMPASGDPLEEFEVREVLVTLFLPKDNPARVPYMEARKRREKTAELATVRSEIEFIVEPKVKLKKFDFSINLNGTFEGRNLVGVYGAGTATRTEEGSYVATIGLFQPRPLELGDQLSTQVVFRGAATTDYVNDDPAMCKVTIKSENFPQE